MSKEYQLENLKALLRYKNISYGKMGKVTGLSTGTFSDKINNSSNRSFNIPEITIICDYLDILPEDIPKYFFEHYLNIYGAYRE